jgi:spermidine/putrescine-binding protein
VIIGKVKMTKFYIILYQHYYDKAQVVDAFKDKNSAEVAASSFMDEIKAKYPGDKRHYVWISTVYLSD